MSESFGGLLRTHRRAAGLTQEALAERARLSGQAIGALERGDRRFPRQDTVARLADALRLSGEPRAAFASAAARRGRPPAEATGHSGGRASPHALPYDIADFTGRTVELAACERWVSTQTAGGPLIVAVNGMAGCGKSTLAVHVAHRFAEQFPDGQFCIDLRGHTPGHDPVPTHTALGDLLQCLGIPRAELPAELEHRAALWRSEVAGRRTLIVLDNALDIGQLRPLLPGSPGHLVLVTSRQRLADLDGAAELSLEPMPTLDAAELFARVAQRPVADRRAVAEVVDLCGQLPLAIRLAATRLRHRRSWTVAELADRLRDQQLRLGELAAGSRSVAGAFELSYRQLPAAQRRVFRLLGLHPGPDIDRYAAAALCGLRVDDAQAHLDQLTDAHLLREDAAARYTFHDLLRAYASAIGNKEESEADRQAARTRLVDYYLCAAAQANRVADPFRRRDPADVVGPPPALPDFPGPREVLGWCERERLNLLRAIDISVVAGRDVQAWQLAQALVPFFSQTGNAPDRHDTQRVALDAARRLGDRAAEANILVDLGSATHRLGRRDQARQHYEQAIELAGAIGDAHAEGRARRRLAILHQSDGDYARAEHHFRAALTLFQSIDDQRHVGGALACLAVLYGHAGRHTESMRAFTDALSIMNQLGPLVYPGRVYDSQAWLYWRLGRHTEAHAQFDHALRLAREVGDREGELRALSGLGVVHSRLGDLDLAQRYFHQILDAADRGMMLGTMKAQALRGLGFVHSRLGRPSEAVRLYEQALSVSRNYGSRVLQVAILNDLADTHSTAGSHTQAADHYAQALNLAQEIDGLAGQQADTVGLGQETVRARHGLAGVGRADLADGFFSER